jgi:hypothetical protein
MRGMPRTLVVAALVLSASAAAFAASCDANVSESCVTGPCLSLGAGGAGMAASSSSAAGSGGQGTGGTADTCSIPATTRTGDIPCDVFAVVHPNCNPCHQNPTTNGAPFPLLNYSDTQQAYLTDANMKPTKLVFQQMFDQTRPDACPRMPLGGKLDAQDYATLSAWLVGCAPPAPAGQGCGCAEDGGACICEGGPCP